MHALVALDRLVAPVGLEDLHWADQLSQEVVGSHVEHILTKLGAARRAEIAAWVAALPPGPGPAGS